MASVGPIGNTIFVNQMTPAASSVPNAHNNRVDLQNVIAQAAAQEEKKEIEAVRPAEEAHKIDPDREHERQEADEETKRQGAKKQPHDDEENTQEEVASAYKLDIKV